MIGSSRGIAFPIRTFIVRLQGERVSDINRYPGKEQGVRTEGTHSAAESVNFQSSLNSSSSGLKSNLVSRVR